MVLPGKLWVELKKALCASFGDFGCPLDIHGIHAGDALDTGIDNQLGGG